MDDRNAAPLPLSCEWVVGHLPPRDPRGHKGTFGRALLDVGSERYPGAALLAAEGAFRAGAGMVFVLSSSSVQAPLLSRLPEAIFLPRAEADALPRALPEATVCLCGCGAGSSPATADRVEAHLGGKTPLVLDADGLNALAACRPDPAALLRRAGCPVLLTPHPLEFVRLFGEPLPRTGAERLSRAREAAAQSGAVVLLKGPGTVIASPDGRCAVNPACTSALAKAGSGDVLGGIIVGLCAQGADLFTAACLGAWLHGRAGEDLAATQSARGVLPSELPLGVARLLSELCGPA